MDDPILTTREAALILGVSIRTVQTWIEQKEIDSWKTPGGHRRVRRSAVLALRERMATQNPDDMFSILVLSKNELNDKRWSRLDETPGVRVALCDDELLFLIEAGHLLPAALVIELARSDWHRMAIVRRLLFSPKFAHAKIVIISDMRSEQIQVDLGEHVRLHVLESNSPEHEADQLIEALSLRQLQVHNADSCLYPVANDEDDRLLALQRSGILNDQADQNLDHIVTIAAQSFRVPIALVTLLSSDRQHLKARHGLAVTETPRAWAFCNYTIMQKGVFVVEDARTDPRFESNLLVKEEPAIRFYAGVAVRDSEGWPLGALCIIDRKPRSITREQKKQLMALAELASASLHQKA